MAHRAGSLSRRSEGGSARHNRAPSRGPGGRPPPPLWSRRSRHALRLRTPPIAAPPTTAAIAIHLFARGLHHRLCIRLRNRRAARLTAPRGRHANPKLPFHAFGTSPRPDCHPRASVCTVRLSPASPNVAARRPMPAAEKSRWRLRSGLARRIQHLHHRVMASTHADAVDRVFALR